jgi:hypothetical protein
MNTMGYMLSVPAREFVSGTISSSSYVANAPDAFFSEELHIVRDVFMRRGFVFNKLNSSTSTSDVTFNDYIQAYENGNEHCVVVSGADGLGYSKSYESIQYSLHIICAGDITTIEDEQIPLLQALGYRNSRISLTHIIRDGDFVTAGASGDRGGSTVILKKEEIQYRLIAQTQEDLRCDIVEKEKIPLSVLENIGTGTGKCFEDNGQYRQVQ